MVQLRKVIKMANITKPMLRGADKVIANGNVTQSHGVSQGVPHITVEGLKVSFTDADIAALEYVLAALKAQAN